MEGAAIWPPQAGHSEGEQHSGPSQHPDGGKSGDEVHRPQALWCPLCHQLEVLFALKPQCHQPNIGGGLVADKDFFFFLNSFPHHSIFIFSKKLCVYLPDRPWVCYYNCCRLGWRGCLRHMLRHWCHHCPAAGLECPRDLPSPPREQRTGQKRHQNKVDYQNLWVLFKKLH